jgi:hypothetical protein
MALTKSNAPTKKWWTTQITALAALAVLVATSGHWSTEATVALIGLISQAGLGWVVPNDDTPGGVPLK